MSAKKNIIALRQKKAIVEGGGEKLLKTIGTGKMTARDRIHALLDKTRFTNTIFLHTKKKISNGHKICR